MRYSLLLVLLLLVCNSLVYGQNLTGTVLDADGKPLAGAAVIRLSPKDSTMQEGALVDDKGSFTLKGDSSGTHILRAQALGFLPYTWVVTGNKAAPVTMKTSEAKKLKEVEIVAQRPYIEIEPDKIVVNVAGSINAQGNHALDLLRKSPGVVIDKDDNVSLKGKGARILIDGKPTQMSGTDLANYLKNLQASDVETMELITNPSAKYEAAGSGGIINIRLKKNKNYGTNGSVSATYAHGIFNKHNQSINLNNRNKRVNIFGNLSTYTGANRNTFNSDRTQTNTVNGVTTDTLYAERSPSTSQYKGYNYKGGVDFFINARHTIGVLATGGFNQSENRRDSYTSIRSDEPGAVEQRSLSALSKGHGVRIRNNANINYRYQDTAGHELTVDLDYGRFNAYENNFVPNKYRVPGVETPTTNYVFRIYTPIQVQFQTVKADYEQKLWGGKFSTGARVSFVQTRNTFDFFDTLGTEVNIPYNETRSNQFVYREQISAAYTQYRRNLGKYIKLNIGLRVEQTHSQGTLTYRTSQRDSSFNRLYTNLFPSGGLTFTVSKNHTLGINFSRRIDRPNYESLNPFQQKQDDFSYRSGNPYLLPQFTQSVELSHTFKNKLNTSLNYSKTTDAFAEIVAKADSRRVYIQSQNLARIDALYFNISSPIKITSWWQGFVNIGTNYSVFSPTFGNDTTLSRYGAKVVKNISGNGYMQQNFTLGKGFKAEVSGYMSLPGVWGGTFKTNRQGSLDFGIQKSVMNNRGIVKVSYSDLFYTAPWSGSSNYGGIKSHAYGNWESQQFRVSFDYRFGSNEVKAARARKLGADDVDSRVK